MTDAKQELDGSPVKVTDVQRDTVIVIARLSSERGFPPTIQEVATEMGVSLSLIQQRITLLRALGFVSRERNSARTLKVLRVPD